ncbi:hypothetical protein NEAUS04_1326 [Nematocida ausubeli]|uniref:Uncharacterized protein n=1 Tax=Nematocida ausubeli (strain ATCC PRA-371 / ERTm2) TaxID=1913371 RepID=H8ZDW7_NEMA1|nr:hypothetical protein NERG_01788 [Nematocida ausubeli]KAI5148802.1 hypothetical protein NEAUS05_1527 [Nematocida ausubeli]KAI5163045.1 hypothetical protein NEAUS04_1326 [Nematocida ausubeli]
MGVITRPIKIVIGCAVVLLLLLLIIGSIFMVSKKNSKGGFGMNSENIHGHAHVHGHTAISVQEETSPVFMSDISEEKKGNGTITVKTLGGHTHCGHNGHECG